MRGGRNNLLSCDFRCAQVQSDILNNLPLTPLGNAARLGLILIVVGVFPLVLYPIVAPVRNFAAASVPALSRAHNTSPSNLPPPPTTTVSGDTVVGCVTVGLVALVTLLALRVTSLGLMNVVSGALGVLAFVGFAPALVGLYLINPHKSPGALTHSGEIIDGGSATGSVNSSSGIWTASMWLLLLSGLFMTGAGLVFIDNDPAGLAQACMWKMAMGV